MMTLPGRLYELSLALLTDLYELTMAYGYFKSGMADREAVFHLTFRQQPFAGGYSIACGLGYAIDFLSNFRFEETDVAYLRELRGNDDRPLFDEAFLQFLSELTLRCDVDALPEGTVVFPHEPLIRVRGPILQAQILETALLNIINFQTLIATKASRICQAAKGDSVMEFGLRRAQGIDGALAASRAAYIGGCGSTSNVLAGKLFGIPVVGTQAHSWIMCFDDEEAAFERYAEVMPNNCVFLVDTYSTLEGVRKAIDVGRKLRQRGFEMIGVRLDSGDLAYLSIEARRMLDAAGFPKAVIIASNELDEHIITSLKLQGATIGVWGVGTKLVTAFDQPAMGGVYKLSALRGVDGRWQHKIKLSEQTLKISTPGVLQIRRFRRDGEYMADMIYDEDIGAPPQAVIVDPADMTRRKLVQPGAQYEDLLVPIFRAGRCVYDQPPIGELRRLAREQVEKFHPGVRRFVNPHEYPVGLERGLHSLRTDLIFRARGVPT
jgi:nicotinate phosphoribosyltransferase